MKIKSLYNLLNESSSKVKNYKYRLRLPRLSYAAVVANEPITIIEPVDKPGGLTLEEIAIVSGICKKMDKCNIFELGAYRGRTTVNIAYNCQECKITTFDLPLDNFDENGLEYKLFTKDRIVAEHDERGFFFRKYPSYEDRITHIYGDSATFDFSPYFDSCDIVFIDASHRYENVLIDSETSLKLLKNGKGIILWHDYSIDNIGVVRAIHEFKEKYNLPIYNIKRTKLAYVSL